jgi:two-component system sensor histidine kinase ChiS
MDGTVISDAVNLASRIEELTKFYGVQCLVSQTTYYALSEPARYPFRCIDRVKIRGKKEPVTVYEMFGGDSPELQAQKRATQKKFEEAADLYRVKEFAKAAVLFGEVLDVSPEDKASRTYIERCRKCSEARDGLARY